MVMEIHEKTVNLLSIRRAEPVVLALNKAWQVLRSQRLNEGGNIGE